MCPTAANSQCQINVVSLLCHQTVKSMSSQCHVIVMSVNLKYDTIITFLLQSQLQFYENITFFTDSNPLQIMQSSSFVEYLVSSAISFAENHVSFTTALWSLKVKVTASTARDNNRKLIRHDPPPSYFLSLPFTSGMRSGCCTIWSMIFATVSFHST